MKAARALILNVDDTDASRYVKSRILKAAGFEVIEAATGAAARELVAARSPDLVLLDVRLPDCNGRQLAAEIKSNPGTAQVVVLQTSATHVDAAHRVASLEAGADGYLVEPIEPEELVANVRALLRMREAEHERQAALEQLQEADRRKDEFLAMLAHELRNPLAPIRNAVEILRISDDREVRERARQMVARQVTHLARLVDDLLDVSRITQRKIALKPAPVALDTVIEAAVEIARPLIDAQGHALEVHPLAKPLWMRLDAVRMAQAVGNLLHNAAKFTPSGGGRIRLEARVEAPDLLLTIEDNGVGITPETLDHAFDLFSQGERSLDRSQGGLGIGLSLVKGLVEMHGGRVTAASDGAGKGSRFIIALPLSLKTSPVATPAPIGAASLEPRRVLVVEDNVDAAESMRMLLQGVGHDVVVVNDGGLAIAEARRLRPEVIVLDIGLPGMDGYQLAAALRAIPETSGAHLIAVSGYGQEKDRARSRQAGFDLHLVKPVDPAKLTEAIARAAA